ncbi:MAG: hypothetical protein A3B30_00505 [Candidatus Komeilibacteria bacterium RIFCSPLOWO2_01_FULL_52_15]|uniref:CMP/dCMP-type deaminase domain-containing protein n=1 Tax=Candidatus Komeilibacteria bacterium RIFCSPLOWO2_01_FULL_52_15 TaxID=1798551 RepID=A0A1G2BMJ0_9BACT|nr:MAG: hypothetical protein A3B30_00505 [Candidatus Komeilibacteria bacterium RIFCSPLOWO2_01_FULL_52_15]
MQVAIDEAIKARDAGDYAVGAVIVKGGKVIARASNRSKRDESPVAHAETLAILEACKIFKSRHLLNCVLYTTHEPCTMCASVIVWAKLAGAVYGARIDDMKQHREHNGNHDYQWRTIEISCDEVIAKSTEKIELVKDFMREECMTLFHS